MCQNNCNTKNKKGKYLSYEDRVKIGYLCNKQDKNYTEKRNKKTVHYNLQFTTSAYSNNLFDKVISVFDFNQDYTAVEYSQFFEEEDGVYHGDSDPSSYDNYTD